MCIRDRQKIDVKFNAIDSQIDRVEKQINENNEILINSMNEHNNEIEYKINKARYACLLYTSRCV